MNPEDIFPAIKDIKPTIDPPSVAWGWIVGGVIFALVLTGILIWLKFRRKNRPTKKIPSPVEEAQAALSRLNLARRDTPREVVDFYGELSMILRRFLHRRYDIPAEEMTTDELVRQLAESRLSADQKAVVMKFVQEADLVKFAGDVPSSSHALVHWNVIRRWIDEHATS